LHCQQCHTHWVLEPFGIGSTIARPTVEPLRSRELADSRVVGAGEGRVGEPRTQSVEATRLECSRVGLNVGANPPAWERITGAEELLARFEIDASMHSSGVLRLNNLEPSEDSHRFPWQLPETQCESLEHIPLMAKTELRCPNMCWR